MPTCRDVDMRSAVDVDDKGIGRTYTSGMETHKALTGL